MNEKNSSSYIFDKNQQNVFEGLGKLWEGIDSIAKKDINDVHFYRIHICISDKYITLFYSNNDQISYLQPIHFKVYVCSAQIKNSETSLAVGA